MGTQNDPRQLATPYSHGHTSRPGTRWDLHRDQKLLRISECCLFRGSRLHHSTIRQPFGHQSRAGSCRLARRQLGLANRECHAADPPTSARRPERRAGRCKSGKRYAAYFATTSRVWPRPWADCVHSTSAVVRSSGVCEARLIHSTNVSITYVPIGHCALRNVSFEPSEHWAASWFLFEVPRGPGALGPRKRSIHPHLGHTRVCPRGVS